MTADVEPAALALRSDPARAGGLAVAALGDAGARSIVCLVDETALSVLVERCAGAVRAAPDGTTLEVLHALDPDGDPSGITAAIAARLIDRPDIDAVLLARPGVEAEARLALDGAADGRERLLAVIGPAPDDAAAASSDPPAGADPAADLGVDPRATDQGWLLITGLALVVAGERPGEGPGPRLEVVPAAWP